MKQKIEPADIRKGDLIRWEPDTTGTENAIIATEYRTSYNGLPWRPSGTHYLLHRPEPPFEPHWGMVIGNPSPTSIERAVYLPEDAGGTHWLCSSHTEIAWGTDKWAKRKLNEGWVVIEKPEGVK